MIPVRPEELSALMDGELDPQRAAEVEFQIAADLELQATFETLRHLDARWRAAARTLAFVPHVRPPSAAGWSGWVTVLAVATALAGVRAAVRLVDTTAIAFAFQAFVLAAMLVMIARLGRADLRREIEPGL